MCGFFIAEFSATNLVMFIVFCSTLRNGLQIWLWCMKAGMDALILLLLSPCYKPFNGFPLLLKWERLWHNLGLAFFCNGFFNFSTVYNGLLSPPQNLPIGSSIYLAPSSLPTPYVSSNDTLSRKSFSLG